MPSDLAIVREDPVADFQIAAERAKTASGARAWGQLSLHEQSTAIYVELAVLDAEHLAPGEHTAAITVEAGENLLRRAVRRETKDHSQAA